MKKYLLIERKENGSECISVFDTLEKANEEADYQWSLLTDREKKETRIFVVSVEDNEEYLEEYAFDDDKIDFTAYHTSYSDGEYFDSDLL